MELGRRGFIENTPLGIIAVGMLLFGGCKTEPSLLEFEKSNKNKLLDPREHSLRKDWVFLIAKTLSANTGFRGKLTDLTTNFLFAYSQKEYEDLYKSLPPADPDFQVALRESNALTAFSDQGPIGSVIFLEKLRQASVSTGFEPTRVVGIVCAHEMGHRTLGKPRDLANPFRLPGVNADMLVTKTQGLKLRGHDINNPRRPLNYLEQLQQTPPELQARQTYQDGYTTPSSPLREAVTLLSRMERLCNMLQIQVNDIVSYERASDPLGLMDRIGLQVNASEDYNLRVIFGINLVLRTLSNNWIEVARFLGNPRAFVFQSITIPQ